MKNWLVYFCLRWISSPKLKPVVVTSLLISATCSYGKEPLQLLTFKTFSRISIALPDSQIPAEISTRKDGFDLLLRGMTLTDLALSEQQSQQKRWVSELKNLKDSRLQALSIQESETGLRISGTWRFPGGRQTLAFPEMEVFDYLTTESAQYTVDFWVKEGLSVLEYEEGQKKTNIVEHFKKIKKEERSRQNRKIAAEKAHAESENWTYFCQESLSDENDLFLRFYPIHKQIDFFKMGPHLFARFGFQILQATSEIKRSRHG